MAKGVEEISTSRARRRRGAPRESLTASSLVAALSVEELRSFCQVLVDVSLELLDGVTVSTVGGHIISSTSPGSNLLRDFAFPSHRW